DAGRRERREGPSHRQEGRLDDAEGVDLRRRRRAEADADRRLEDAPRDVLADVLEEDLGVVQPPERDAPREHRRARVDRTGEAAAPDLVDAGHDAEARRIRRLLGGGEAIDAETLLLEAA